MKQETTTNGFVLSAMSFMVLIVGALISSFIDWWAWYTILLSILMGIAGLCMVIFKLLTKELPNGKREGEK